jgi:hypothetical protein
MLVMNVFFIITTMVRSFMNMSRSKFYKSKPAMKLVRCILCGYEGRARGFVKSYLDVWVDYECLLKYENDGTLKQRILEKVNRKNAQEKH